MSDHVMSFDCPCAECQAAFHPPVEKRIEQAKKLGEKIVVRIEIEYDDGLIEGARGADAFEIWSWLMSGQAMNSIHGAVYKGPQFTAVVKK
jgi:hypothetical protein